MLHFSGSLVHDSEPALHDLEGLWTTAAATVTTAKPFARRDACRRVAAKHLQPISTRPAPETHKVWYCTCSLPQTCPGLHAVVKVLFHRLFVVIPRMYLPNKQITVTPECIQCTNQFETSDLQGMRGGDFS